MKNKVNRALVAKKKIFTFIAALTLSVGLWADDLDDVKTAAIAEIEDVATAAKEEIDAASSYEAAKATQNQYKESIDAVVSGAIYNINNATSEEAVAEEVLQTKTDINQLKSEALAAIAKINESEELKKHKVFAIIEIDAARQGIQHVELNNWIRAALVEIPDVTTKDEVDRIKGEVLRAICFYKDGKAEGKAELVGEMGEPCTDCTAVEVKKGDKVVTLYAPESVSYIKVTE